jgi:hypothetical protein
VGTDHGEEVECESLVRHTLGCLLVGGLGIDLAVVSGGWLTLAGGGKGGWWQHGIVGEGHSLC